MSTDATTALSRDAIAAVDPEDRLTDVLALPEHLRDALWKVESAPLSVLPDSRDGLVIAGMGQSGIAGLLARAALADHASRPIAVARAYGLPPYTTPETTVLLASYSGETEETLACFEAAGLIGCPRVVVTSGGTLARQARAEGVPVIPVAGGLTSSTALGYMIVAALEVAAQAEIGPHMTSELDVAAEHLEALVEQLGPDSPEDSEAKALARALAGTVPVVYGAGLTTALAWRWKASLNVTARMPAFAAQVPDAAHHEVAGWEGAADGGFSAVFLDDADSSPRVQARVQAMQELIAGRAHTAIVASRGQTAVERVLSLVLLGDLVAHYCAALKGIDPASSSGVDAVRLQP